MQRKEILASKNPGIMSSSDLLDNRLIRFGNLITRRGREIYTQRRKMVPKQINEELTVMTDEGDFLHEIKIKCSVSSHVTDLTDFRDSKQYFMKIKERALKDEKVFVVHKINQKLVYGKVEYFCGHLLFHSLTLTEDPTDAFLILFDDLKQFSDPNNFYVYIKVTPSENSTRVILIKMLNRERTHPFVKLCTGEDGPTYKGASFTAEFKKYSSYIKSVINVPHFMENGCEVGRPADFSDKSSILVRCEAGKMYLSFQSKTGGFKIFNVNETKDLKSIVGKVMISPEFWHSFSDVEPSNLKIIDCGIVFDTD